MERERFLRKVGAAAMRSSLPGLPPMSTGAPRLISSHDPVGRFRERAISVNAVVHGPMSRHGVPRAVAAIASGHSCTTYMAWDDLDQPGVHSSLVSAGLTRVDHQVAGNRIEHQMGYMTLDLGVTGASAGLAESGSIVLEHGPGRPRMASLIPDVHIALLDVELVVADLGEWARSNPAAPAESSNLVIVTGPSRTGDIELQLNLGVHGPRHVHIVLVS